MEKDDEIQEFEGLEYKSDDDKTTKILKKTKGGDVDVIIKNEHIVKYQTPKDVSPKIVLTIQGEPREIEKIMAKFDKSTSFYITMNTKSKQTRMTDFVSKRLETKTH